MQADVEPRVAAAVDPSALRQILLNLLDNAVKYGPRGQTVRVAVERAGAAVRLTVEDGGPGVTAEERERIWEPFVRGRAGEAWAGGGSGIGLAVVRDLAERHGGRAWVEATRAGVGARFVVELPAAAMVPDESEPGAAGRAPVGDGGRDE